MASPLSRAEAGRLARAVLRAEGVARAMISLAFVGPRRIRGLNRRHCGRDRETDVVAFTLMDARARGRTGARTARTGARTHGRTVVGDIYVCAPVGVAQSRRFGATPQSELRRLVVHGLLHVLGWDHPDGPARMQSAMWRRQERLLTAFARRR